MARGLNLGALTLAAGGAVLMWSGVNDPQGGPVAAVSAILHGKTPTPGTQKATQPLPAGSLLGSYAGAAGAAAGAAVAGIIAGMPAAVVAEAVKYLGTPYLWGGTSHNGIDCSGLVLVAYRDGAGVNLPHLATAQMARGKRIPREQVQAGDLVGWGVPGNYPHIAIATGYDQVIAAPHPGAVVQYQRLWEAKVPGFGLPDIARIVG